MSAARAKLLEYSVTFDSEERVAARGSSPLRLPPELAPEHLLLAALVRCSLASLRYHARRDAIEISFEGGSASGLITKRDSDGRYAFVEIDCRLDVLFEPWPGDEGLTTLIAKAERDCFVGASLTPPPSYTWSANGEEVARQSPT